MEEQYQQSIAGLESSDPAVVLSSAIWLVENPEYVEEQNYYLSACELLQAASQENVECLQYIDESMVRQLGFKAQLFSSLVKEGPDEIQSEAKIALENLIKSATTMKTSDTDVVAQVYSSIEESADPVLIEKARSLLQ